MPIDPYHLDPDRRKPKREVTHWTDSRGVGWALFGVGLFALAIAVVSAKGQPELRVPFLKGMMIVYGIAFTIMTIVVGSREGVIGAWFFWNRPFSSLDPESRPKSPVAIAIWALIFLGIIASVLLLTNSVA